MAKLVVKTYHPISFTHFWRYLFKSLVDPWIPLWTQDFELPPTSWKNEVRRMLSRQGIPSDSKMSRQDLVARLNQVRQVRDDLLGMDFTKVGKWRDLSNSGIYYDIIWYNGNIKEIYIYRDIHVYNGIIIMNFVWNDLAPQNGHSNRDHDNNTIISNKPIRGGYENWLNFAISCWVCWVSLATWVETMLINHNEVWRTLGWIWAVKLVN